MNMNTAQYVDVSRESEREIEREETRETHRAIDMTANTTVTSLIVHILLTLTPRSFPSRVHFTFYISLISTHGRLEPHRYAKENGA